MIDFVLLSLLLFSTGLLLWTARARRAEPHPVAQNEIGTAARSHYWKLLRQAGLSPETSWRHFVATKIACILIVPLTVAWMWDITSWGLPFCAVIGFLLPDVALASVRRKRQALIRRALSSFLDFLVSMLQAGLSLEEAFSRTARSALPKRHPLAKEAALVVAEMSLGRERSLGFHALATRTGLVELGGLANALQLGFSLGASVEATLKAQADLARAKRREESLKRVQLANAEVLLPLMLCGFPVFLVLVVLPLGLRVVESLGALRSVLR